MQRRGSVNHSKLQYTKDLVNWEQDFLQLGHLAIGTPFLELKRQVGGVGGVEEGRRKGREEGGDGLRMRL